MFRGEPLSLKMILTGFIFFIILQISGLFIPEIILQPLRFIIQIHFILAFLGWIGFVILGAQLQFFKAISGIRRYEPIILRKIYYLTFLLGIFFLVFGHILESGTFVIAGLILYILGASIHSYWMLPLIRSKLFKFPLNYLSGSHFFLLAALIIIAIRSFQDPFSFANNFDVIHILSVGWISLNLQGALIRAGPMFLGQVIDRNFRSKLEYHFKLSVTSSAILSIGFIADLTLFIAIGFVFWVISWIWVFALLYASILPNLKNTDYKITLAFLFPGMIFLSIGAILGSLYQFTTLLKNVHHGLHIHTSLLAGLSIIMLGVIHRVTSFQIYTILYTGRREVEIRLKDFLKIDKVRFLVPGLLVSPLLVLFGFLVVNFKVIIVGAILNIIFSLLFGIYLLTNVLHYRKEIDKSIPFWLKKGEIDPV